MASEKENKFIFTDEEDRPYISGSSRNPGFRVGDKVYLLGSNGSREGPYVVAKILSTHQCTLSLENGQVAKDGTAIEIAKLEAA